MSKLSNGKQQSTSSHDNKLKDESDINLEGEQQELNNHILEEEFSQTSIINHNSEAEQALRNKDKVYFPRTPLKKVLPAFLGLMLLLLVFTFSYWIADKKADLLSTQFLIGVPFFIGASAVYYASLKKPIKTTEVFKISLWLIIGILLISFVILQEGVICIVIASPILYGALLTGGLVMHLICSLSWRSKALHSVVILPFLVLFLPLEQSPKTYQVTHSTIIKATPEQVWQSINHIEDIEPENFYQKSRLLPFMQVPTPKSAITIEENGQQVRKCEWHGGIAFDEPLISQVSNKQLRWQFVFHPNSVPPKTLDDHVTINGEHFKLLHGQYDIDAINTDSTRLTFNVTYRITTNMNSYAGFWGKWVMNEFVEDTLGLYKNRLELVDQIEM